MKRNKIRKEAFNGIAKQGKSHQEFFDSFRSENKVKSDILADEVSKIPSVVKMKETTTLRYIFAAILLVILVFRIFGVSALIEELAMGQGFMILALLLVIAVPIIGIVAALTNRSYLYYPVGMLMALAIFRSMTNKNIVIDETTFIVLIPIVIAIILAFYIPSKLKTKYERKVNKEMKDGNEVISISYTFEEGQNYSDDILDSGIY